MCSNTQRKTDACCYFTDCIIVENLLHVFCNERHLVPYPRILLYVHISCKLTQHFPFFVKAQVARAHVSRKSQRGIHERVTRCVTSVLSYGRNRWKFEHVIRNSMGNKLYGRFATINISKYEYFTRKINKTHPFPVYPS